MCIRDRPWVVNPSKISSESSAVYLFAGDRVRWNSTLATRDNNEESSLTLNYQWKQRSGNKHNGFVLSGKTTSSHLLTVAPDDDDQNPVPIGAGTLLQQLLLEIRKLFHGGASSEVEALLSGSFQQPNSTLRLFEPFGALDIKLGKPVVAPLADRVATHLTLRSGPDLEQSLIFASSQTNNLAVQVRYGSGTDPEHAYTTLKLAGPLEGQLHEPSDGIARSLDENAPVDAKLKIDSETDFGSQTTIALNLTTDSPDTAPPKISYFQAKPFLYAAVSETDRDPEGGLRLASWRSDDAGGGQWRMPYRAITLEMPSQSVGEEMERGNRFWGMAETHGYIDENRPIRYRFSPPTRLVLQLSLIHI